jgi:UDPglucose 6-dehydrogenase/UDP-N-acetyl-D-galactosamine dehydrogenase
MPSHASVRKTRKMSKDPRDVKSRVDKATVCIVGLGYVGLPLVSNFSKKIKVIGYDIKKKRVAELQKSNRNRNLVYTHDPKQIARADFVIICVPTPVTPTKDPDLSPVISAATAVGQNFKKGCIVILESTVYPGVTEDIVAPVLEKESGLKCGRDFRVAYAPERVNPGDKEHTVDKITKVVSGMDDETRDLVAELYSRIIPNIFKAADIKTAEAAKVIENIQRDLNIALMNELSLIFEKLGLDTKSVLDAASTKWNFHRYSPGLVGGHCIPVDPYYLVHRAKELGYHSQVISAGRAINDSMAKHVAEITVKALNSVGKVIKGAKVLVIGLTYKENVPDTRETPQKHLIEELKEYGVNVFGYDPLLNVAEAEKEFGIKMLKSIGQEARYDAIVLAVTHDIFKTGDRKISLGILKNIMNSRPVLVDIRRCFDKAQATRAGLCYRTL